MEFDPATTDNPGITEFISQGASGGPGTLLNTKSFAITTTGGTNTRVGSSQFEVASFSTARLDNVRILDAAITPDQDTGITGTPEPSTMFLAGLGVAAALVARRREARQ